MKKTACITSVLLILCLGLILFSSYFRSESRNVETKSISDKAEILPAPEASPISKAPSNAQRTAMADTATKPQIKPSNPTVDSQNQKSGDLSNPETDALFESLVDSHTSKFEEYNTGLRRVVLTSELDSDEKKKVQEVLTPTLKNYENIDSFAFVFEMKRNDTPEGKGQMIFKKNGDVIIDVKTDNGDTIRVEYISGIRFIYINGEGLPGQETTDIEEGLFLNIPRLIKRIPISELKEAEKKISEKRHSIWEIGDGISTLSFDKETLYLRSAEGIYVSENRNVPFQVEYDGYKSKEIGDPNHPRKFTYPTKIVQAISSEIQEVTIKDVKIKLLSNLSRTP